MDIKRFTQRFLPVAAFALFGTAGTLLAAANGIGSAVSNGSFELDRVRVWGNATVFEGSTVETTVVGSQLALDSGAHMRLAASTRAHVYQNRLVLEKGSAQLELPVNYEVETHALHMYSASPQTIARIRVDDGRKTTVAAVRGAVRVTNASGLLVANIDAGRSLDLQPQEAGAAAPTHASGCLLENSGKFILVDQTTNVSLELLGAGLKDEVGNRVEVDGIGSKTGNGSHVIKVANFKRVAKGGCKSKAVAAAAAGAAGAAGAGAAAAGTGAAAAAGISMTTVAVIGGVAAAATVGGLAAAGGLPGQGEAPSPVSH